MEDTTTILPCDIYLKKFELCRSKKHQDYYRFVNGTNQDCAPLNILHQHCLEWEKSGDAKAAKALIDYEHKLFVARVYSLQKNDVWSLRASPPKPEQWNRELPRHLRPFPNSVLEKHRAEFAAS